MTTPLAWLAAALGAVLLLIVALVAFAPRDHKVELVVTWPSTPPARVWQLLTRHADEPRWLTFFASAERQPDDQGRPVWTYRDATGSFSATMMTILAVPERRYERILLRKPGAGSRPGRPGPAEPQGARSRLAGQRPYNRFAGHGRFHERDRASPGCSR